MNQKVGSRPIKPLDNLEVKTKENKHTSWQYVYNQGFMEPDTLRIRQHM